VTAARSSNLATVNRLTLLRKSADGMVFGGYVQWEVSVQREIMVHNLLQFGGGETGAGCHIYCLLICYLL
jgi:hypothetical protein